MAVDGYEQPLIRALTEPILLGGVPREVAILNTTLHAAAFMGSYSLLLIGTYFVVQIVFVKLTKQDPDFFYAFRRHIKQKNYYGV